MARLLPLLIALIAVALGAGAGFMLRPGPDAAGTGDVQNLDTPGDAPAPPPQEPGSSLRLDNQFVVPLVEQDRVVGLVVLTLGLEVAPAVREQVFAAEPRLRDGFLRVLFDHANSGGFSGNFTRISAREALRTALRESARATLGAGVHDVLIIDMLRQDV